MPDPTPAVTLAEANLCIARLSREAVAAFSEPEQLDAPLDADIKVGGPLPGWKQVSLIRDGQELSWCGVVEHQQQVGDCVLRMGGIAGVGTHNDHRFQGYSRRVLTNALRWMRQEGFDVSMLYGISGFYPKYGYAVAFPTVVHTLAVRDAERGAGGGCRVVDYEPGYLDAVLAIFHAHNAGRTGVTRRDPLTWAPFRKGLNWGSPAVAKVLLNQRGRAVGYFVHDAGQETAILEVGAAAPVVYGDILRTVAALAWSTRAESIRFHLAEDDPFILSCRPLGLRSEMSFRADGGAMVRMINVNTTLEKLLPHLPARLRGHGSLTLHTNLDTITLRWGGGRLHLSDGESGLAIHLPQWALAQLIYGYHDVATLAHTGAVSGSRRSLDILARLFPPQAHYHYTVDHF